MSLSCLEALWLRILNPPNTKTERADATAFVGGVKTLTTTANWSSPEKMDALSAAIDVLV